MRLRLEREKEGGRETERSRREGDREKKEREIERRENIRGK